MEKGSIAKWMKKVGDRVKTGEVMAEVQTDKATVAFESVEDGYIAAILGKEGEELSVGAVVALLVESEADIAAVQAKQQKLSKPSAAAASAPAPAASPAASPSAAAAVSAAPSSPHDKTHAQDLSPAVGVLLANANIDPASIAGTGKGGRILKGDVLLAIKTGSFKPATSSSSSPAASPPTSAAAATTSSPSPSPAPGPASSPSDTSPRLSGRRDYVDLPLTNMRKVIASRLSESKRTIPHAYATAACRIDGTLKYREAIKARGGEVPSMNDFVILAAAIALRRHSKVNSIFNPKTQTPQMASSVDVSVAVATPAGLITPILFNADSLRLSQISNKVKELAAKARDGKLAPAEFQGGSFTISNLGMFGISSFSAVINLPQAAILAVGGSQNRVVPTATGALEVGKFMEVQLSYDERVISGDEAAAWLESFAGFMADPAAMLL